MQTGYGWKEAFCRRARERNIQLNLHDIWMRDEIFQVVLAKKPWMNPAYNGRMKHACLRPGESGDPPAS